MPRKNAASTHASHKNRKVHPADAAEESGPAERVSQTDVRSSHSSVGGGRPGGGPSGAQAGKSKSGKGGGGGGKGAGRSASPSDATSARASSAGGTSQGAASGGMGTREEVVTSLAALTNLNLTYANKCAQAWMHSRIWFRLSLMLVVPFVGLVILLAIGITGESETTQSANNIQELAELAQNICLLIHELSGENTDCLWYSLDLGTGITLNTGGLTGKGLLGRFASTDVRKDGLLKFLATVDIWSLSTHLGDLLSYATDQLKQIEDFRYGVQIRTNGKDSVMEYYKTLTDSMLEIVDFIAALADRHTIRAAQALISWSRTKTNTERERATGGLVILTQEFSDELFAEWQTYIGLQTEWKNRFLAVAPDAMRLQIQAKFRGLLFRQVQDLRQVALDVFVPNRSDICPNMTFFEWWNPMSAWIEEMRAFRATITADIVKTAKSNAADASGLLAGYIVLAILCTIISVGVVLLVGWSVSKPWAKLSHLRLMMSARLSEKDRVNAVVDKFVPHEFLAMMEVKTLYDLQLGSCSLKRCTILCVDIRNFSALSERMAPHQNFAFLSRWIEDTAPTVRSHGGFIDKFRDSGVTALFMDPNDAIDTGLALLEQAQMRNSDEAMSSVVTDTGVAVHTGDLMLGSIGEEGRMETTIIAEAMQLALRAIHLSSMYKATMLISKETYVLLNVEGLTVRFAGEVDPGNGFHSKLQVYEVLLASDEAKMETLTTFNQAIKEHQAKNLEEAIRLYDMVLSINANDALAARRKALAQKGEWIDTIEDLV